MELDLIKKELENLDYLQLKEIEDKVKLLIIHAGSVMADMPEEFAKQFRSNKRFDTNFIGTVTRLTDLKSGQKNQYTTIVSDISNGGIGLRLPASFVPARLIDVQFTGNDKKIRKYYLDIVRIKKTEINGENFLDIGCKIVSSADAEMLIEREKRIGKMKNRLDNKVKALILLAGAREDQNKTIISPVRNEGYQIRRIENIPHAIETATKMAAQLLILSQGTRLLREPDTLQCIINMPKEIATLAIIDNEEDKARLYQAGIDECITIASCENYLFHAIERAMLNHAYYYETNSAIGKAIVCGQSSQSINMAAYYLIEMGYKSQCISNMRDIHKFKLDSEDFDIIFAEYDEETTEDFRKIMSYFPDKRIVAMCKNFDLGRGAMACGAENYLTIPACHDDVKRIINKVVRQNASCRKLTGIIDI
ncbi:MAG: PilZ domain-containing protein [Phycisphaerae bacterium]|nr:PilZ domain-containing protein [Phycisphaerae bacterium]